MKIALLAGGVGGAKFAQGLRAELRAQHPEAELSIVANVGDDMWLSGLKVCPDLDSLMYALAGANDEVRGWGRAGESERVSAEMTAYGAGWPWFTLGDLDLGTHIARTGFLRDGLTLTEATARLNERWELGVTLLPASDDDAETWVVLDPEHPGAAGEPEALHFEEWWVRLRATVPAVRFERRGREGGGAVASPTAVAAIGAADVVIVAPSNPVVSIGTMAGFPGGAGRAGVAGLPGIAEALRASAAPVVGVSPIIESSPLRGMARQCLEALAQPCTAEAVGLGYGARSRGGIIDGWLVDTVDAAALSALEAAGLAASAVPLWMRDEATSRRLAADALAFALSLGD
ncbi:2-phospho-L-lactate transferase [Leucobacter sp. gxy201]|uniref:2-phospho-L-lactate transferase n=1 Tax=Leucobacter sp. gxy201 TaxID=2957200 RepID=UPI003DA042B0